MGGATRCGRLAGMVRLFDGDLGIWGNTINHPHSDIRNEFATRSTVADVARPRVRCLLRGDESEEEVQRRVWRGPRALCHRGGDGEGSLREVRIRWFHSVEWCMVGQRHYGDRSCMAVASLVWCSLGFLDFLLTRDRVSMATF